MALPLAPVAALALKYGIVAFVGYTLARRLEPGRTNQLVEDEMDKTPEGVSVHKPRALDQLNAALRFRRVLRMGPGGPGVELDATMLARFRMRRV